MMHRGMKITKIKSNERRLINTGAKINNEPKKEVLEKNPNLHSEFEDISSFTAESGK